MEIWNTCFDPRCPRRVTTGGGGGAPATASAGYCLNKTLTIVILNCNFRYLYVNCRKWTKDYTLDDDSSSNQELAKEFHIRVIDLHTMQDLGDLDPIMRAQAVTECSLIDLDISKYYIARYYLKYI